MHISDVARVRMQVAQQAKPTAEQAKDQGIRPAAEGVKQNARPLADTAIKQGVQPGAKAVAEHSEPVANQAADDFIKPVAQVNWACCVRVLACICVWACMQVQAYVCIVCCCICSSSDLIRSAVLFVAHMLVPDGSSIFANTCTSRSILEKHKMIIPRVWLVCLPHAPAQMYAHACSLLASVSYTCQKYACVHVQNVHEQAVPITDKVVEHDLKPAIRENAPKLEGVAQQLTQEKLQPGVVCRNGRMLLCLRLLNLCSLLSSARRCLQTVCC